MPFSLIVAELLVSNLIAAEDAFLLSLFSEKFVYRQEKLDQISRTSCLMLRESKQKKAVPCLANRQHFSLLRAFLQAADHLASGGQTEIPDYQMISLNNFQPHDGFVTGNQEYIKIGNEATSKIATIVHQKR